jgi:hypothetical protein
MMLIGGTVARAAIHHRPTNQHYQIQLFMYCLSYIRLPKIPNHYILALKMATAVFAEMLDNFQHLMRFIPKAKVVH